MPNLTVTNTADSALEIVDTTGLTAFKMKVKSGDSATVKVSDDLLYRIEAQLANLKARSLATYSLAADTTDPAEEAAAAQYHTGLVATSAGGAGQYTLAGAKVGDQVILATAVSAGALVDEKANFESVITVAGKIQSAGSGPAASLEVLVLLAVRS